MAEQCDIQRFANWDAPPFLIAEAGVNHEGDFQNAIRLVDLAADSGVDAIKFQTYKASRIATRTSEAYWDTSLEPAQNQFELFSRYDDFGPEDYQLLARRCDERRILFLTTPFDVDCIDWLDDLLPLYKVASADITNFPLLQKIAQTKKPVLLSTGAASTAEIDEAVTYLHHNGSPQVAILHCTLSYPTLARNANVAAIAHLKKLYPDHPIGFSVHTLPGDSFVAISSAFVLGARIIEKHFTFDKSLPGNDHYHAFDGSDFLRLRQELKDLQIILGSQRKSVLPAEEMSRKHARRSLVSRRNIPMGAPIDVEAIDVKRPGTGIEPKYMLKVCELVAARDIREDETLQWHMFSERE